MNSFVTDFIFRTLFLSSEFFISDRAPDLFDTAISASLVFGDSPRNQLSTSDEKHNVPADLRPYLEEAKQTTDTLKEIFRTTKWATSSLSDHDVLIKTAQNDKTKLMMVYLETELDIPPDVIFQVEWETVADIMKWNPQVMKSSVVLNITSQCRITHQVSAPAANGLIWSREYVTIASWEKEGDTIYHSLSSISWPGLSLSDEYVRAVLYPQGFAYSPLLGNPEKTKFRWVYHADLRLTFLPNAILNMLLPKGCKEYVMYVKKRVADLKKLSRT